MSGAASCIFCDLIAGLAPASVVHRDDLCIAFMDVQPINAGHLLVVPLVHASCLADLPSATGGHVFGVAQQLAAAIRRSGLRAEGINLLLADGAAAGQEVFHVHLHVLPRFGHDGFGFSLAPEHGQPVDRARLDRDAEAIAGAMTTSSSVGTGHVPGGC